MQTSTQNVKPIAIKLLKENVRETFVTLRLGKDFLGTTPKAQAIKEQIDKADFIKM